MSYWGSITLGWGGNHKLRNMSLTVKHARQVSLLWSFERQQSNFMNHHCIMTSSNGNIFHVTGPLCGEFTSEFPTQRPVTRSFDVFFDLHLNKRLSKQSWGWWFETPSPSLWCHCSGKLILMVLKCCECSNSWWNQVRWNGTMILVPYHAVKHLQLLSEDQAPVDFEIGHP